MNGMDSRKSSIREEPPTYVTSEPQDNEWGQPAASQYVFVVEGTRLYGQPIAGVYLRSSESASSDADLAAEMEAWDAASDEALFNFESTLD